jgi:hypothetical protein
MHRWHRPIKVKGDALKIEEISRKGVKNESITIGTIK